VRVVTFAPDALPSFVAPELRPALAVWWLTAASRVGYYLIPEAARPAFDAAHRVIETAMQAELTGGARRAAGAAVAAQSLDNTPAVASDSAGGGDAASSAPDAGTAHELGVKLSKLLINEADTFEKVYASHAVQRMPAALGLAAALDPAGTRAFAQLQAELTAFPANFHVTLVHKQPRAAPDPGSHQAKPHTSAVASAFGAGSGDGGGGVDLVSLPLQAADAVADAVVAILRPAPVDEREAGASAAATAGTATGAGAGVQGTRADSHGREPEASGGAAAGARAVASPSEPASAATRATTSAPTYEHWYPPQRHQASSSE
jgi:hypothetical protein